MVLLALSPRNFTSYRGPVSVLFPLSKLKLFTIFFKFRSMTGPDYFLIGLRAWDGNFRISGNPDEFLPVRAAQNFRGSPISSPLKNIILPLIIFKNSKGKNKFGFDRSGLRKMVKKRNFFLKICTPVSGLLATDLDRAPVIDLFA